MAPVSDLWGIRAVGIVVRWNVVDVCKHDPILSLSWIVHAMLPKKSSGNVPFYRHLSKDCVTGYALHVYDMGKLSAG